MFVLAIVVILSLIVVIVLAMLIESLIVAGHFFICVVMSMARITHLVTNGDAVVAHICETLRAIPKMILLA